MLFLIDSGMDGYNALSARAGRQLGEVRAQGGGLRGMSDGVDKVYSTAKADLRFGHFEQKNSDVTTFDFTNLNRHVGTEISGIVGYEALRMLEVKRDYRDGLVDLEHNPKHGK